MKKIVFLMVLTLSLLFNLSESKAMKNAVAREEHSSPDYYGEIAKTDKSSSFTTILISSDSECEKVGAIFLSSDSECEKGGAIFLASDSEEEKNTGESLLEEWKEILPDGFSEIDDLEELKKFVGIKRIFSEIISVLKDKSGSVLNFLLFLIACSTVICIAGNSQNKLSGTAKTAVSFIFGFAIFIKLVPIVEESVVALCEINAFFEKLIPIFTLSSSACGNIAQASSQNISMQIILLIFGSFASDVLCTLSLCVFFFSFLLSVGDSNYTLTRNVGKIFTRGMGLLTFALSTLLTLQTVVSTSVDSATQRALRYAVGSSVPLVGGAVSSALSVLTSGVSYAKSIIGGGSIIVIFLTVLSPIITLLCYRVAIYLCTVFMELSSSDNSPLLPCLHALDTVISVYAMGSLVYILECVLFLKGGATIFA